jgi:hypothetical protein
MIRESPSQKGSVLESRVHTGACAGRYFLIGDTYSMSRPCERDSGHAEAVARALGYGLREELAAAGADLFCEEAEKLELML